MTAFEPGEGWRRTFRQEAVHRGDYLHLNFANEGAAAVYWVREEPVPLLPTWTVICYPSRGIDDASSVHINTPAGWALVQGKSLRFNARGWQPRDGFEVLAEPRRDLTQAEYEETVYDSYRNEVRRETAKAVLALIAAQPWAREVNLQKLRDEFGVAS